MSNAETRKSGEAEDLLRAWLAFSRALDGFWWAVKPGAARESHTAEGVEMAWLQEETKRFLEEVGE